MRIDRSLFELHVGQVYATQLELVDVESRLKMWIDRLRHRSCNTSILLESPTANNKKTPSVMMVFLTRNMN